MCDERGQWVLCQALIVWLDEFNNINIIGIIIFFLAVLKSSVSVL